MRKSLCGSGFLKGPVINKLLKLGKDFRVVLNHEPDNAGIVEQFAQIRRDDDQVQCVLAVGFLDRHESPG